MAKEKPEVKKVEKPKVTIPPKEKHHDFPRLLIVFGIILVAVSITSYLKIYNFPKLALEILLLLAGLWMFQIGIKKGFYHKRKEIFKKYI